MAHLTHTHVLKINTPTLLPGELQTPQITALLIDHKQYLWTNLVPRHFAKGLYKLVSHRTYTPQKELKVALHLSFKILYI